jgi:hypothetical protein
MPRLRALASARAGDADALERARLKFPTAAIAVPEFTAPASWSTEASVTRSGCRWHIRNSPSSPPATALSAIPASGTVNRLVACPPGLRPPSS